ncbi:hypothetical protein EGW08_012686 [Elysia chlorotica]|uniref:ShKT domain-containing protein n=1 Tax=Elysia chlorotica TaxID=188477 RepID=A0A433TDC5_ELYCH|nr:hypothetical protein EGW08_012686 [Elysia chlorotica]
MFSYFKTILLLVVSDYSLERAAAQDGLCADKVHNCRSYGQDVCVNYSDWAKINCASTCAFCSGPTPMKECKDYVDNCGSYASVMCTDSSYRTWAEDNCSKFCGFCVPPSSTVSPAATTTTTVATVTSGTNAVTATTQPATQKPVVTVTVPPNAPCLDTINFCIVYSKRACTDIAWADTYCRKWCARC